MRLILERVDRKQGYTGGMLYVGEKKVCDTLEDTWRDLNGVLGDKEEKKNGITCIPDGEYEVSVTTLSPKYVAKIRKNPKMALAFTKGYIPRLLDVPQFQGVLIHTGNKVEDTEGCILVGTRVGRQIMAGTSVPAFRRLYGMLKDAADKGEKITIKITNTWT